MELKTIEDIVEKILSERYEARLDDFILYGFVLQQLGYNLDMPLKHFLVAHKREGMPSFKSVERARRKVQERNKSLKDVEMSKIRDKEQDKYINYNRS